MENTSAMENTSDIALSSLSALRHQMDVIANNIANANTSAYRAERVLFEEYLADIGSGQTASFVRDSGVLRDTGEGPISPTGSPMDMAISGKGYFVVETDDGLRYTRNGHFKLDGEGTLVNISGHPVLNAKGDSVQVGAGGHTFNVSPDGVVSTASGRVGRLDIVLFDNEQQLSKAGDGLYATDAEPIPAPEARVLQGMIEGSNVKPIIEMTEMIRLVRRYQSAQRLLEQADELRRRAVETLGGTN